MKMHVALIAASVDIGRNYLDFAIASTGLVKRFPWMDGGVEKLVAALAKHQVKILVLETIGPFFIMLPARLAWLRPRGPRRQSAVHPRMAPGGRQPRQKRQTGRGDWAAQKHNAVCLEAALLVCDNGAD